MTMHLLPAYYTTTKTKSKSSKSKSGKPYASQHDVWLLKRGLHPEQIKTKKTADKSWRSQYSESLKVDRGDYVSSGMSGSASSCIKRGVMANLHREPPEVQKAILEKASRVMPLYNKGGLQLLSPADDLKTVGTLSRRG